MILTIDVLDESFYVFAYIKKVQTFYDSQNEPAYVTKDFSIRTVLDDESPLLIDDHLKLLLLSFPEIFE